MHTCPPDHRHSAALTCAKSHGCKCDRCMKLSSRYAQFLKRKRIAGIPARGYIPARGTQRRLRALATLGHSINAIADACGISSEQIRQYSRGDEDRKISARAVEAVTDHYRGAAFAAPPRPDRYTNRVRNAAAAEGWLGPLAWADIDNDEHPDTGGNA